VKPNVLNRRIHYWVALLALPPLLVIIGTGLLLQMKKNWAWVQPPEIRGTGTSPAIEFDALVAAAASVPGMHVNSWDEVNRVDVRPDRGLAKVWLKNGWEVQVDLGTGEVLQTAYRRSDVIETIHDGSFFAGDLTKLGLFLPAGLVLLVLWMTGAWMIWVPIRNRRRIRRARQSVIGGPARPVIER
jgi:uncharacterized iron-regulated membrane protein